MFIPQKNHIVISKFILQAIDLDWVATKELYSQEFDLYKLLQSILGKLNNRQDSSETIESFTTNFTKTSCMCSYILTNGCPLTTAVRNWLQRSEEKIRANQTRFGMVSENLSTKEFQ